VAGQIGAGAPWPDLATEVKDRGGEERVRRGRARISSGKTLAWLRRDSGRWQGHGGERRR
jgi:hypothetical protein